MGFGYLTGILGILVWIYACLFAKKNRGKLVVVALLLMVIR